MLNLEAQITSALDALGIHLDTESFENLLRLLRVDRLSWMQKLGIAVGVGVLVEVLRQRAKESALAKATADKLAAD